ncbi:hypothetical protein VTK56DRAFT_3353 [Thermocarpiscus australiensis]
MAAKMPDSDCYVKCALADQIERKRSGKGENTLHPIFCGQMCGWNRAAPLLCCHAKGLSGVANLINTSRSQFWNTTCTKLPGSDMGPAVGQGNMLGPCLIPALVPYPLPRSRAVPLFLPSSVETWAFSLPAVPIFCVLGNANAIITSVSDGTLSI